MLWKLGDTVPESHADGVFVAPGAAVIGDVHLGPESSVWFGAVLRGDIERITIGRGSNIQDGSVLHTDPQNPCTVGEYVTVGHMAMLHGCSIGNNTLVGIGSTILNGARIGANSIVGAHALITEGKQFPDGVLLIGAPAEVARELRPDEFAALRANADRYISRAKRYLRELKPAD